MTPPYRILAIDGGGIRGIIPATLLAALERYTARRVAQLFDLVVGTSTGGILALGLSVPGADGKTPRNEASMLLGLYGARAEDVFPGGGKPGWKQRIFGTRNPSEWLRRPDEVMRRSAQRAGAVFGGNPQYAGGARYFPRGLESVLEEYLGDAPLPSALIDVIIPSYDMVYDNPVLFSSRPRKGCITQVPMRVVGRATSAGPTYFEPQVLHVEGRVLSLVDGGVYINNPSLLAFVEGAAIASRDRRPLFLLSLGTGTRNPAAPRHPEDVKSGNWLAVARQVMDAAMTGGGELSDAVLARLSADGGARYWRIQTTVGPCDFNMDNSHPDNLACLRRLAEQVLAENEADLKAVAHEILVTN